MKYPNQKEYHIVQIPRNAHSTYGMMNINATYAAALNLSGTAFKLWVYLNLNQRNFKVALGPTPVKNAIGLSGASYTRAVTSLKEMGYLVEFEGKDFFIETGNMNDFKPYFDAIERNKKKKETETNE